MTTDKEQIKQPEKQFIKPRPKKKKSWKPVVLVLLFLALVGFGGFYFYKYQTVNNKYQDLVMTEEDRVRGIVLQVAKLYNIPTFEQEKPQWSFIKDDQALKKLKEINPFFNDAKINDVLLAYQKADKAILFRPSDKKIVNTSNYTKVTLNPVGVAIIAPADKHDSTEKTIKEKIANANVVSKTAPKTNISTGVVVDVTGKAPEDAKKIADLFGLQVGTLPVGEAVPQNASFIVILPNGDPAPASP